MAKYTPAVLIPFYGWHPLANRHEAAAQLHAWRAQRRVCRTGPGMYKLAPKTQVGAAGHYTIVAYMRTR